MRQKNDRQFAEILNRFRTASQTEEDLNCINSRVIPIECTPRTILLLLPPFGRPRSLGGIYHQVGILLSSCSCSSGHHFGLGSCYI